MVRRTTRSKTIVINRMPETQMVAQELISNAKTQVRCTPYFFRKETRRGRKSSVYDRSYRYTLFAIIDLKRRAMHKKHACMYQLIPVRSIPFIEAFEKFNKPAN